MLAKKLHDSPNFVVYSKVNVGFSPPCKVHVCKTSLGFVSELP